MVINIMNLYKYKEILENINIIVIFSIPIISLILYTLNKRKVMILENLIYIGEFFIYLYLNSYIIIGNINLISMILILKFVIILTLKEKLKINNFLYKFILILGLLYVCNIKVEYSILINIILNIIILKCSIIDCIKLFNKELLDNRHDLNQKKSYIKEVKKKIKSEKELQKNYKDEILGVSNKISKSIEESDIPIFILDINKKFIYSNEAFNMLIQDYKNKENRIDISKYLQFKFPKYKNLMDEIKKIATEARGNLNIKSYDGKIYRLECITDIIDERPVIVCILKDITQTTLIQNKLEESENMYKNLMDVLNEGVIIHDNKNIKYINDKGLEILDINISKKEIFIEDIKNIVSKKFREKFLSNIQLVISRKEEKVINKIELINGRIVELVTTNIKLNAEDLLISIVIDITELENLEKISVKDLLCATGGELIFGDENMFLESISTSSGEILKNTLFIPIKGERFDAHDFLGDAVKNGATGYLTEKDIEIKNARFAVKVLNTKKALMDIAHFNIKRNSADVVALTGSVGKTTTKEFVANVLGEQFNTIKTQKNYNNEIGMPFTAFGINSKTEKAVIEMGMSNFGEIEKYSLCANPDTAIITNIGVSHIEYLKSREGILKAKS